MFSRLAQSLDAAGDTAKQPGSASLVNHWLRSPERCGATAQIGLVL